MAARFCTTCGRPLPGVGAFCPSCGAPVAGPVPPTGGPGSLPGFGPGSALPAPPGTPFAYVPSTSTPEDRRALSRAELAAVVVLVGSIASLASSAVLDLGRVGGTVTGATVSLPPAWFLVVVAAIDFFVAFATPLLFRSVFRALRPVDRRFETPARLALLAVVGIVLLLVGVGFVSYSVYAALSCTPSGQAIPISCLATGPFWAGVALAAIGGIVALVGWIGMLIGIWRLGSRYGDARFKVGAVLLIFPLLNIIGAILLWVGARDHRS